MRYWWVNHKQTVRQEIDGGYLWSPKRTTNNRRNRFYDNMREARPGDRVLSFADTRISYVGRVTRPAAEGAKPAEFGTAGDNWNRVGWHLPVEWTPLPRPVQPKLLLDDIAPLLPKKYSPFSVKARGGNQGAYLAEISEDLFRYILDQTGAAPLSAEERRGRRRAGRRAGYGLPPAQTEREQKVNVRIGQGLFRTRILDFEQKCRLTGIANPRLLVASHIKPWRVSTPEERLDGANGLLLTPHVDRLFDRGLISFEDTGEVKVSPRLPAEDLERLGLTEAASHNSGAFDERQQAYLAHHRTHTYKAE